MLNPKAQRLGMFGRGPGPFAAPELPTAQFEPVAAPSPMMQPQRAQRPSTGRMIAGHIGDALMAMNGLRPMFGPAMQEQRQMQLRQQMAEAERMAPQRLTINGNLVEYDPSTGSTRTLFSAPQEAPEATALQRNYEFMQRINPEYAQNYLRNESEGAPITVSNGDGTYTVVPRAQVYANNRPQGAAPARPQIGQVIADPRRGGGQPTGQRPFP